MITLSLLFKDVNLRGQSFLVPTPHINRYGLTNINTFSFFNMNDATSSLLCLSDDPSIKSHCILYEHSNHQGKFKAFAFNPVKTVNTLLPDFNDVTSSMLVVNHVQASR